jgi:hypothetical protein
VTSNSLATALLMINTSYRNVLSKRVIVV